MKKKIIKPFSIEAWKNGAKIEKMIREKFRIIIESTIASIPKL